MSKQKEIESKYFLQSLEGKLLGLGISSSVLGISAYKIIDDIREDSPHIIVSCPLVLVCGYIALKIGKDILRNYRRKE